MTLTCRPAATITPLYTALVVASLSIGCGGGAPEPPAAEPTVTEIDGVRMIENHAPRWPDGEGWRISAEPMLTLGVDAGDPSQMFTYPHPVRLANGHLVIADRGAQEIRAFDAAGRHLWTSGGEGQGPGEFGYIGYVFAAPQSEVLVFDANGFRLTTFTSEGELIGTFELEAHGDERYNAMAPLEAVAPDGSLLAMAGARRGTGHATAPPGERGWRFEAAIRYQADGSNPGIVGQFDAGEIGPRSGWTVPFAADAFVRPHPHGYFYVNGRDPYVADYTLDGELRMRTRRPGDPLPVRPADNERWIDKARANFEVAGQPWDPARVDELVYTETMPMWRDLMVDAGGNAWVERHLGLQHSQPWYWSRSTEPGFPDTDSQWDVFDSEGTWLGTIALVPGLEVEQIGDDWMLMTGEDESGVARVYLYELIKTGRAQ